MPGRGRTIAGWSAALGLLTVAVAAFFFEDSIREAWHIHKLETGYLEEKIAAARRLGELKSARAAPALIEACRVLCVEAWSEYQPRSFNVFPEAMWKIGKPALLPLVRAVPKAFSMIEQFEDGGAAFYLFVHSSLEVIALGKAPPEPLPGESVVHHVADLRRILESLRDDPLASPELREAAVESLKAFP